MLLFSMFRTQSILPSNRSPLLSAFCASAFSFLPPRCHPACPERSRRERSEGSAFRLPPLRSFSLNGLNSRSPLPFNIPTFKPSNVQPTPFSCHPVPNPFKIRISAKCARNSCRICSSKTQDLKPFRIRIYEKKGRGAHPSSLFGGTAKLFSIARVSRDESWLSSSRLRQYESRITGRKSGSICSAHAMR